MDYAEARHQLLLHGPGTYDPAGNPVLQEDGFVASLRPYRGLHEKNFHLVVEALLSVGERIHRVPEVDRDIVHAVWMICETGRGWGLHPGGMLQRNKLITPADTNRLELWIDTIEGIALRLLGGGPPHHVIYHYAQYVVEVGWWDNAAFFVELMAQSVSDPAISDAIEIIARALGKLGPLARASLPALREAEHREYTWYTPAERCTEEVRGHVRRAIQAIEACSATGGVPNGEC